MLNQEWSKFYDGLSADSKTKCSRTEFVTNMTGTWLLAVAFGADKILKAELQDIEDGTLPLSFSEISANRITYKVTPTDDPTTIVLEDGEWHPVDDGTCGKSTEDTPEASATTDLCSDFTEWNSFSQAKRDSYDTNGDGTGLDEWLILHGCPQ